MTNRPDQSAKADFWALADQGVVSLGSFLTTIVLARRLPQLDYGIYITFVTTMLFFNGIHASVVTYPLSAKAAGAASDDRRRYAGAALTLTIPLVLLLSGALILVAALAHRIALAGFGIA